MGYYRYCYSKETQSGDQPFPEGLLLVGVTLPVQIEIPPVLADELRHSGQTVPQPVTGHALVDTGCNISGIDITVVQQLNLQPIGKADSSNAHGLRKQKETYAAQVRFPDTDLPKINFNILVGFDLSDQADRGLVQDSQVKLIALLGRDILTRFILIYDGLSGSFTLAC